VVTIFIIPSFVRRDTGRFDEINKGRFEAYISQIIIDEISAASEPKQSQMANILKDITVLDVTDECNELAQEYIDRGICSSYRDSHFLQYRCFGKL